MEQLDNFTMNSESDSGSLYTARMGILLAKYLQSSSVSALPIRSNRRVTFLEGSLFSHLLDNNESLILAIANKAMS